MLCTPGLNNRMTFASHSNVRPDNSWIRGPPPPVPPKPPKHLRPKPLPLQESHRFPQYSQPLPSAQTSHYQVGSQRQTNQFLPNYGPLPPPLRRQPIRRDLYNQMDFASHTNIRPDNSWIRGPPPPVPPKQQRLSRIPPEMSSSYARALSPPPAPRVGKSGTSPALPPAFARYHE